MVDSLKLIDFSERISKVCASFERYHMDLNTLVVLVFEEAVNLIPVDASCNEDLSHLVHEEEFNGIVEERHIGNWEHALYLLVRHWSELLLEALDYYDTLESKFKGIFVGSSLNSKVEKILEWTYFSSHI